VVAGLAGRGIDAITSAQAGLGSQPDAEHVAFCAAAGRTIVTGDSGDFARIHAALMRDGQHHAGIIVAPPHRHSIGDRIRRLSLIWETTTAEQMVDVLDYLTRWRP
jgi:hypothetical protein